MVNKAILLAQAGFFVFPIAQGKKQPPVVKDWQRKATWDQAVIEQLWGAHGYNIGISTSVFNNGQALIVVDVDVANGKRGEETVLRLELEGRELPPTYAVRTPSGGAHYYYRHDAPVRQGANVLGPGVDIRSAGGYVVGEGSTVGGAQYVAISRVPVAPAPAWLVEMCGRSIQRSELGERHATVADADPRAVERRIAQYLATDAPLAVEGAAGDETTYKVALHCRDIGGWPSLITAMMLDHWNPRCSPPWGIGELQIKVSNAFSYAKKSAGHAAPEADFKPVEQTAKPEPETKHPYDKMNDEYAFVVAGGGAHILRETTDASAVGVVEHLDIGAFKQKFAPVKMIVGKKEDSIAAHWMEWKGRRSYDGIVFSPGKAKDLKAGVNTYFNLWRGFAFVPAAKGVSHQALDRFLDHTQRNICQGNARLAHWLLAYCAHMVQRPWDKPLVSLVFRGGKGVGKNAFIERVGTLLGRHFLLSSNRRYLIGNFNGHLEHCLLFALDEAFWSGDKQAEGTIKDLITGREHVIEHKGKEPYTVANKTRVVIIGNEDWLIPASHDERRFAVFDVGSAQKQNRTYFQEMREWMEAGGYPVLLRYLLDYDISGVEINQAPNTQGLLDQKIHSLNPFYQWVHQCLADERINGSEFAVWPESIDCDRFKLAFQRYAREHGLKLWHHEDARVAQMLAKCIPSAVKKRARTAEGLRYVILLPSIEECRKEWDQFMHTPTLEDVL